MKKTINQAIVFFVLLTGFASCSKSNDTSGGTPSPTPTPTQTFTRKAYVEDFTGTWCGWCPLMSYTLEQKKALHGKKLIYVGMHYGPSTNSFDPFHSTGFNPLLTRYGINAFPTGLVDRQTIVSSSTLAGNIDLSVATAAKVGIQLESTLTGTDCALKTTVKFVDNFSAGPVKLVLMLVEDDLKYNQVNYLYNNSNYQTHPYYTAGNPMPNYTHNGVFRRTVTPIEGETIPSANTALNAQYIHNTTINVTGLPAATSRIIALVISDNGTASGAKVLNAQEVKIGQSQLFD